MKFESPCRRALTPLLGSVILFAVLLVPGIPNAQGNQQVTSFRQQAAGIDFYVETRGSGPDIVLVPSGQGDSQTYDFLAVELARDYTVITFDMPGFSRSGPPPSWDNMSAAMLGNQVAALVKSLGIDEATFYGSSSGGVVVLALVADHPELVRNAIVHEPAIVNDYAQSPYMMPFTQFLPSVVKAGAEKAGSFAEAERIAMTTDDNISKPEKLQELGEEYLERRAQNRKVWYDRYLYPDIPCCTRVFYAEELRQAPVTVTVGLQSSGWTTAGHIRLAQRGGLNLVWVPAKHFAYVSIPEVVAEIVRNSEAALLN